MVSFGCALDETRMRMSGLIGAAGSNPSCGSVRPDPKDSQLERARSIVVGPVAAHASLANVAAERITAARNPGRAEEPFGDGTFITGAETLGCRGRH